MENIILKIQQNYPFMSEVSKSIALYILEKKEAVLGLSIEELAECCHTSTSAIVRFCKLLDVNGYREFRMKLTNDFLEGHHLSTHSAEAPMDITGNESLTDIIARVANNNMQAIRDTQQLIDEKALREAVQKIAAARRVDFYGVGSSGLVAMDASQKFIRIGKYSCAISDVHVQITMVTSLRPEDVAVIISYSGQTKDMLDLAGFIKESGAYLLLITSYSKNNPLALLADNVLYVSSPETTLRSGATGSRIAQLTIIDMLFFAVVGDDLNRYVNNIQKSFRFAHHIKYRYSRNAKNSRGDEQ